MLKWRKGFKPEVVLAKLRPLRKFKEQGSVAFEGFFDVEQHIALLQTMVDPPNAIPHDVADGLIVKAVFAAAKHPEFDNDELLKCIEQAFEVYLATRPKRYRLITSLSLSHHHVPPAISLSDSRLTFFAKLPDEIEKLKDEARRSHKHLARHKERTDYTWVVAEVQARSDREAGDAAIQSIDLVRGIWNIATTDPMRRTFSGRPQPINKVLLGEIHTLHPEGQNEPSHLCWYEPDYRADVQPLDFSAREFAAGKLAKSILDRLGGCRFSREVEVGIVRYCRALDGQDLDVVFTRLWQVLERLTGTAGGQYDETIRRTSFLFEDWEYEREVLRHLRARRNAIVHQGSSSGGAETAVYLLKSRVEHLVRFLLRDPPFNSLADAAWFMDLPPETSLLRKRMEGYRAALNYRREEEG